MKKELLLWILGSLFAVNGHYLAIKKETNFGLPNYTDAENINELTARDAQYCQNGAFQYDSTICNCPNYFNGPICSDNLCMNGGYTSDDTDDNSCECPPGYIGVHCETEMCKSNLAASGPLNAFSRKTAFSFIVHNRLDPVGQRAANLLKRAVNSSPINGYIHYQYREMCYDPSGNDVLCFEHSSFRLSSFSRFLNEINMLDPSPVSTQNCFQVPNLLDAIGSSVTASSFGSSNSAVFVFTQHPVVPDLSQEQNIIQSAIAWGVKIFVFYVPADVFSCGSLTDPGFLTLQRLTKATNGQFVVCNSGSIFQSDPETVFSSLMTTQLNNQVHEPKFYDNCTLSLTNYKDYYEGQRLYISINSRAPVAVSYNGASQLPTASFVNSWSFYNITVTGNFHKSLEVRSSGNCDMLVYDNSETTLFVSFVTEESSSKDVSSSTLVEGIPMWPVLHVNGPTSITSAITSISLTYTTENGIMSAPLVGMLREGCLFDWIFNGNITCEPQNTIVTLEFAFLDSSNSPLLRRVFPGFCSPPAAASATMPTITATSSPADCSNPDIVSCPMTNRQPFAVDTNFRTLTFMMEVNDNTQTIMNGLRISLDPTKFTTAVSTIQQYNVILFGASCSVKSVILTQHASQFLGVFSSDINNLCDSGSTNLQDAFNFATKFLGPQKGLIYTIINSTASQINDFQAFYSSQQPLNQSIYIIAQTHLPTTFNTLPVLSDLAISTGGMLVLLSSTDSTIMYIKNMLPILTSKTVTLGSFAKISYGQNGKDEAINIEDHFDEIVLTLIKLDGSGANLNLTINTNPSPTAGIVPFVEDTDRYTKILHYKSSLQHELSAIAHIYGCDTDCLFFVQVTGGQKMVVRFTDSIRSDFPTLRPTYATNATAIISVPAPDTKITSISFGLIDQSPLTPVNFIERPASTCTFNYATILSTAAMTPLPRPNFLKITGLTFNNVTFTKYLPFIVQSGLVCLNNGIKNGIDSCSCPKSQYFPSNDVWAQPDCSQIICLNGGTPNVQMDACSCPLRSDGYIGRYCDIPRTPHDSTYTTGMNTSGTETQTWTTGTTPRMCGTTTGATASTGSITTTVTSAPSTPTVNSTHSPQECACTPQNIWLDIVLVVDVSNSITADGLLGAKAFLKSIVGALTVSQVPGKTARVAIVGFAATAQVFQDFNALNSTSDALLAIDNIPYSGSEGVNIAGKVCLKALRAAEDVIDQSDERPTAQNVVFLVTSAYNKGSNQDPHPVANQLKDDGTTIITVAYAQEDTSLPPNIDFASPGYNFTNQQPDLFPALGRALCDVNCFCLPRWVQFTSGTPGYPQYKKYGECLFLQTFPATWDQARQSCIAMPETGCFLMDELSADKHQFAKALATAEYPEVQSQGYWTGLNNKDGFWSWDRGNQNELPVSGNDYSNWMSNYPLAGSAECVADVKFSGFIMKWKNLPCSSPFTDARVYFCQTHPCDTDNYCG